MAISQKRWCVFTSAGDHNAVRVWLKGNSPRQWDLVIAYYGDDSAEFSQLKELSTYICRARGGKFQNLKKLIDQRPEVFDQYSYVWVCDDDIEMSGEQIDKIFEIAEFYNFWIAQPAFLPEGKSSYLMNLYNPDCDYRIVNFIEVSVPIFRRDKLTEFLKVYDGSLVGWGIDDWYGNLFRLQGWDWFVGLFTANKFGRLAIIDKVQVINPLDEAKGGREIDRLQPTPLRQAAWTRVKQQYHLIELRHKVFASCKMSTHPKAGVSVTNLDVIRQFAINLTKSYTTFRTHGHNAYIDLKFRIFRWISNIKIASLGAPAVLHQHRPSLAEQLGFKPSERFLIVHADDVGLAHSVNAAFFEGARTGLINTGSIMIPCAWSIEATKLAKAFPEVDLGIHLTLTSEWSTYRWGPVAPPVKVCSLIDREGYFHRVWMHGVHINSKEVEIELRAQIEKAYSMGLHPTHLDSHDLRLQMAGPRLFQQYLRLGREYGLPVLVAREWVTHFSFDHLVTEGDVVIDHIETIGPEIKPKQWATYYSRLIKNLKPGVTQIFIHPGIDDEELRALTKERASWGSAWRQRDFDFFTSNRFRSLLAKHDILLINWREIGAQLKRQKLSATQAKLRHL